MELLLSNGISVNVDKKRLNNFELLEAICETESGNVLAISKVIKLLLGDEEKNKIFKHIKEENDGIVPIDKVAFIATEIINLLGENSKN